MTRAICRRRFVEAAAAGLWLPGAVLAQDPAAGRVDDAVPLRLGAAWRGPAADSPYQVGVLEVDWRRGDARVRHATDVPSRPHGLLAEPDGALLALALRPGHWIVRLDAQGRVARLVDLGAQGESVTLDGHAVRSADGAVLFTSETGRDGEGRIGVRDSASLRKLDDWPSHGREPHQLLVGPDGDLFVANGGIRRGPGDRKLELDRMESSLVRLDGRNGTLRGRWRLDDPRLSLRHLAWSDDGDAASPRLGIALQAEHDDPAQRREAPVLAVWRDGRLELPTRMASAAGYGGDICAAAGGGFVISSQRAHGAVWWRPDRPAELTPVAQLREACALTPWRDPRAAGVFIAAARGIARWHPARAPAMLPWPRALAPDNHWVVMAVA